MFDIHAIILFSLKFFHFCGLGYMQWYQMFEYAIGHWLQKATEHMMGCVLCR